MPTTATHGNLTLRAPSFESRPLLGETLAQPQPSTQPSPQSQPRPIPSVYTGQIFNSGIGQPGQPDPVRSYLEQPSPQTLSAALKALAKPIETATRKYARNADPIALGRAKKIVADSLSRYEPSKGSIQTYIDRQLQGLQRWSSRRGRPLKTPDMLQMQSARLGEAERRLENELGRPPSSRQLADETGLPLDVIARIRRGDSQVFNSSFGDDGSDSQATISDLPVADDQRLATSWIQFVKDDLNDTDQYILEHTLGLNGAKVYDNQTLAAKLKMTPGRVSQRKANIQRLLDKQHGLNPFGDG